MQTINFIIVLGIGLLSLDSLSSCTHTRQAVRGKKMKKNAYQKHKKTSAKTITPDLETNPLSMNNLDVWHRLHIGTVNNYVKLVKSLLKDTKIDVNLKDVHDWTLLHYAAAEGHIGLVNLFLKDTGIQVNIEDKDGWTPLHLAVERGHIAVVQSLLEVPGIQVNKQTKDGWTPLHLAVIGRYVKVVESLLKDTKIHLNLKGMYHYTALDIAQSINCLPCVAVLEKALQKQRYKLCSIL